MLFWLKVHCTLHADALRRQKHPSGLRISQAEAWALEGPKGAAPGRPQGLPPFIYFLRDPPYCRISISVLFLRLVGLLFMGPCMALFIHAILGYYDWRWIPIIMIPPIIPVPARG